MRSSNSNYPDPIAIIKNSPRLETGDQIVNFDDFDDMEDDFDEFDPVENEQRMLNESHLTESQASINFT